MKLSYFLLILITLFSFSFAQDVVFVTGEWAPYTSDSMPGKGYFTELVSAVCKAAGINPIYKFVPWERAEAMVEKGEAFASFPYAFTEARKQKFDFSDVMIYGANIYLYHSKNKRINEDKVKKFTKIEDFKGFIFGAQAGTFYIKDLEAKGIKVETTPTLDQTILKLKAGRVDFVIDEKVALYELVKKLLPGDAIEFKSLPIFYGEKMPTGLIVSRSYPNSKEILNKFNAGLKKIIDSGEYKQIIDKYNMVGR